MTLIESDVPKTPSEASRFFTRPGFPPFAITNPRLVSDKLLFDVLNRGPLPAVIHVAARITTLEGEIFTQAKTNFQGPFARDEWQLDIPPNALSADLRLSLWPLEIALATKKVTLGQIK